MTTLSDNLQKLKELEAKASAGPWVINDIDGIKDGTGNDVIGCSIPYEQSGIMQDHDPEFIVTMRNSISRLIKTVKNDEISKDRHARGSRQGHSKLTEEQVIRLRSEYATGRYSCKELAIPLSVDADTIWKAVTGRSWKHVGRKALGL